MSGADLLTGRLLVATPKLEDPNFARTVVLLLDHDDDGALGVIISRPTTVPVAEVLPGWSELVSGPDVLFSGGPVATDSALALAVVDGSDDEAPVGWKQLYPGAGLVDLDAPPELLADVLTGMRVFAGYAGWGSGQLEEEVAEGAWYVVPAERDDLLAPDAENLWRRVLRRQPGELAFVHTCPLDPSQN
ncbi:MAG TPA: YqgE/AlgH family protein [Nocardioidaceae bacterium]|jgi:putative transcriptional regulator|nr:YqgE/AlgH family protein [Nocardioidaceae bacterium]